MNRSQWSDTEIIYLSDAYFSGKKVKAIARELNRTEMSISKALVRFSIRPQVEKKPKIKKLIEFSCTPLLPKRKKEFRNHICDDWISIKKMLEWMGNNGINIVPIDKAAMAFKINNIPMTLGQLLLTCNRLRLDKNLNIFRVKGITNV
ncbi:hypothetical protein [Candidatus Paracaedibacter symbiosus]|uniref:hypothetical protein n=1 Tax=Candidatus Paracaedibacter symbiosus TaxID=244582 RepID=UPI000509D2A4|nr:hypothetical protein [Candidatus Paracaedibacter symbiosus]